MGGGWRHSWAGGPGWPKITSNASRGEESVGSPPPGLLPLLLLPGSCLESLPWFPSMLECYLEVSPFPPQVAFGPGVLTQQ